MTNFAWMLRNTNFERLEGLVPMTEIKFLRNSWRHRIDSKFCKPLTFVLEWILQVLILLEFLFYCNTGVPQGTAGHLRPHRMKILPGRMLGNTGNCTREACTAHGGAWRALLPLRMKILPGRTTLKTLDTMALCTVRCLPPFLEMISRIVILL